MLDIGDRLVIDIPAEEGFETLKPMDRPLDILFEDDHFGLKQTLWDCLDSKCDSFNTLANFVKGYYVKQGYENQQVHIVTRLDKDTSGVMLLPNMAMPMPAWISNCKSKTIQKRYYALVKGSGKLDPVGEIIAPIARDEESIIHPKVAKGGKYAHTSYQVVQSFGDIHLVDIQFTQVEPIRSAFIFPILVFRSWEMISMAGV